MRAKKISSMLLVAVIVFLACIAALFGGVRVARAESPVTGTDGRYNVSYTIGGRVRTADITYPIRSADRRGSARI